MQAITFPEWVKQGMGQGGKEMGLKTILTDKLLKAKRDAPKLVAEMVASSLANEMLTEGRKLSNIEVDIERTGVSSEDKEVRMPLGWEITVLAQTEFNGNEAMYVNMAYRAWLKEVERRIALEEQ